jgi:hypothetical protein
LVNVAPGVNVSNSDSTGSVLIGVVLALLVFRWATGASPTLTTYWINKDGKPEYSEVFSPDRATATVVVALRGVGKEANAYFSHKDCMIVDARNWYCDEGLAASDGNVTDQVSESDPRIRSVSFFRWWLALVSHGSETPGKGNR